MSVLFPDYREGLYTRVLSAGYIKVDQWWTKTDLLRTFWRLYLNDQAGVKLDLGRRSFAMPAGRLVIVPPGIEFSIALERPLNQLFVHFEFVGWPLEAARDLLPEPVWLEPEPSRDALAVRLVADLGAETSRIDPVLASRLNALVHLSVAGFLDRLPSERARRALRVKDGQRELLAVLHYIDEHLPESMSNSHLAEIALSSESRFIRRFRDATGRTPARYVQERRLERASALLVSTNLSIDNVAESCGFANRYYFTRVFTRRMGLPPGRYRSEGAHLPAEGAA